MAVNNNGLFRHDRPLFARGLESAVNRTLNLLFEFTASWTLQKLNSTD